MDKTPTRGGDESDTEDDDDKVPKTNDMSLNSNNLCIVFGT